MYSKNRKLNRAGLILCAVLGVMIGSALAQEGPVVTAMSTGDAVFWTPAGDERGPVEVGVPLEEGRIDVLAEQQAMLYSAAGAVAAVLLGPCTVDVLTDYDQIEVELVTGRLMLASSTPADEQIVQLSVSDAAGGRPLVQAFAGQGWTFLMRQGQVVELGYVGETGAAALSAQVIGADLELPSGYRVSIQAGSPQTHPIGPWLASNGFDTVALGQRIGVASAQKWRPELQNQLFTEVITWDVHAQAGSVIKRLDVQHFRPEIRTVAVAVTGQIKSTAQAGRAAGVEPADFANEMPPLSPAAISVGGVTALELNESAANLVRITGSRGLGYRGLSRLALPGLTSAGTRTTGPAGLGAQR
ncbi:MAG: hypothetical protein ABIG44_09880 [Planctomycetota bacterium]